MIPDNTLAHSTRETAAPVVASILFRSVNVVSTTFAIRYVGADNPIWEDSEGNSFQPALVGDVSTVTFPWTDATEKTVTINVDDDADIRGLSETEFNAKGLTYMDLSNCTGYKDAIELNGNTPLTVFKAPNTTAQMDDFSYIDLQNCNIIGAIDLSPIYRLRRGRILISGNANATSFIPPEIFNQIEDFLAYGCGFTTLDLSDMMMDATGTKTLGFGNCPDLVTVIMPTAEQTSNLNAFNSSANYQFPVLAGTLDLSMFTGGIRQIYVNKTATNNGTLNTALLEFKLPANGNDLHFHGNFENAQISAPNGYIFSGKQMRIDDWNSTTAFPMEDVAPTVTISARGSYIRDMPELTGVINLAWMKGNGGMSLTTSPKVTGVLMPAIVSGAMGNWTLTGYTAAFYIDFTVCTIINKQNSRTLNVSDNNWTAAIVNQTLVDLEAHVSGETAGGDYTGRVIIMNGSNAAPDGTSGGFDGLTAKTSLQSFGITVTTN